VTLDGWVADAEVCVGWVETASPRVRSLNRRLPCHLPSGGSYAVASRRPRRVWPRPRFLASRRRTVRSRRTPFRESTSTRIPRQPFLPGDRIGREQHFHRKATLRQSQLFVFGTRSHKSNPQAAPVTPCRRRSVSDPPIPRGQSALTQTASRPTLEPAPRETAASANPAGGESLERKPCHEPAIAS